VQLGSSPTTRPPDRTCSASLATVQASTRLPVASWPVEIQVSPQHSGPPGICTRQPAASSTSTAACPTCGCRWLLKVSGQSMIVPPPRDRTGALCARHTATASAAASTVRGTTTPIGTCRKFDPSVEYAARLPASNLTSPSTRPSRSRSSRPGFVALSEDLTGAVWVAFIGGRYPPRHPSTARRGISSGRHPSSRGRRLLPLPASPGPFSAAGSGPRPGLGNCPGHCQPSLLSCQR